MFYKLSEVFCSSSEEALRYIDCCFPMVSETDNFFRLDKKLVKKILSRSSLSITSEMEVFNAADAWLMADFDERKTFVRDLLLTVRLSLLSSSVIHYILSKSSSFKENKDCLELVNEILESKKNFCKHKSSAYFKTRYCAHDTFNIHVCEGKNSKTEKQANKVIKLNGFDNLNNCKVVCSMVKKRCYFQAVQAKGDVFIFGGDDYIETNERLYIREIERYSPVTNTCDVVADITDANDEGLEAYCVCNFMDKIYLIGGLDDVENVRDCCLEFDAKHFAWKDISRMIEARASAACAAFEERIVVCGGWTSLYGGAAGEGSNYHDNSSIRAMKTAEVYDRLADTWSRLPDMVYSRCYHRAVAIGNKLFAVGGGRETFEVYDSTCGKFVAFKPASTSYGEILNVPVAAVAVGFKIYVFGRNSSVVLCYDLENNGWSETSCEATGNLASFSCVKLPQL